VFSASASARGTTATGVPQKKRRVKSKQGVTKNWREDGHGEHATKGKPKSGFDLDSCNPAILQKRFEKINIVSGGGETEKAE